MLIVPYYTTGQKDIKAALKLINLGQMLGDVSVRTPTYCTFIKMASPLGTSSCMFPPTCSTPASTMDMDNL
jgi:hypothetical protein